MVGSHPLHLRVFSNVPNTFCLLWSVFLSDRLTFKLKFLFRSKQWDKELWWNGSCPFMSFKNFYIPTNIAFWLLSLSAIELTFSSKFLFWWNRNQELWWKGSCPFITFKKKILPCDYCVCQQLKPLHQSSYSDETERKSSGGRVLDQCKAFMGSQLLGVVWLQFVISFN